MQEYGDVDPARARAALLRLRSLALTNESLGGVIDRPYLLGVADARLFVLEKYLGNASAAKAWFHSSVSNLNQSKRVRGASESDSSPDELEALIVRLDSGITVGWRTNAIR
jgi:hypothetical protein